MNEEHGALIVSWDFSHDRDVNILLVGKQTNGRVNIINAFQGEEAHDIYKRLITRQKGEKDGPSDDSE
jgi:predicted GTPase